MSSATKIKKTQVVTPRKTIQGHTNYVWGIAHLPGGKRIITLSRTLRLWDLQSGAQIGDEWRDEGNEATEMTMALSPNGKTIASGSEDGTVRLWDIETWKVVVKWKGHSRDVTSVCWSQNGERVVTGSDDGTVRVWDVKSGEPVQALNSIKTGHEDLYAVSYSPEGKMIATGGNKCGIEIWDAKTGKQLSTIEDDGSIWSLAWTSDEKKLIAGSVDSLIRIFNTATWQQIAVLEGHADPVTSLTLFLNDRLLASTSWDHTACLWNLDTSLQVGPPLQHEEDVECAAFSADGKLLSTGCVDENAYVWDIQAILKAAGLEDLLSIPDAQNSELKMNSLSGANATRRPPIRPAPRRVSQGFFDGVQNRDSFPLQCRRRSFVPSWGLRPRALLAHLPRPFHHSQPNTDEPIKLQQRPGPSTSRRRPSIVEVPALDDKKALYTARRPERPSDKAKRIKNPKWWVRVVLFLCCVSPGTNDSPGPNDAQQHPST